MALLAVIAILPALRSRYLRAGVTEEGSVAVVNEQLVTEPCVPGR